MKKYFICLLLITITLLFCACRDPIYYNISQEEKLLEPLIKGSPTNFVLFNGYMYVASGSILYEYQGTDPDTNMGKWIERSLSATNRNIYSLAVCNNKMYALCNLSGKKTLMVSSNVINWDNIDIDNHNIQNVFAAYDMLFILAGEIGSYYYLSYDGVNLNVLADDTGYFFLTGAAYDGNYYYFTTTDMISGFSGYLFSINKNTGTVEKQTSSPFVGVINVDNTIYAISRNGNLYTIDNNYINPVPGVDMDDLLATGALGIWIDPNDKTRRLFLAGRQDSLRASFRSGYTYGYVEAHINSSGIITSNFDEPGYSFPSTIIIGDNGRYKSTIGKYPVNHIFQAPDGVLFASTQQKGIWSYRNRKNGWHWNAEE